MRFKRKKTRERNIVRMPKAPTKKPVLRKKKKFNLSEIFSRKKNFKKERRKKGSSKYLFLLFFFLILTAVMYLALRYVLKIRGDIGNQSDVQVSNVIGLDNIPSFPGSQFLFENDLNSPIVKEYLSGGNSVYTIPKGNNLEDVEDYYQEVLKEKGWEYIENVTIGTPGKKYGQYWVKDGKGLRIYSKYKDVWYETITEEDARTSLSRLVQEEIEREMLMASSDKQSLLPDFPWVIDIPKEYLIKYSPTQLGELRAVSFQKIGGTELIEIYPVGKWKERDLDAYLFDYCNTKSSAELKYGILNSVPISYQNTLGLKSTIQIGPNNTTAYTIVNSYNSIVYVILSSDSNSPLLQYIIDNIKPCNTKD